MWEEWTDFGALLLLVIMGVAIGYTLGADKCAQSPLRPDEIDLVFSVLWRLLALGAAAGGLAYAGGLLYVDYVRRWRAAHHREMRGPLP